MPLSSKHLLGLQGVPKEDIQLILDTAATFREILERPIKRVPTLQGKTVVNLFYENSTRTRISFELAEKRLSADSVNFSLSTSSVSKGETLKDTIRNIEALGVKVLYDIDEAIRENDVLNVLRIQLERKAREYFPSIREYSNYFGITEDRLEKIGKEDILILHPGPINRGVELSSGVADGLKQIILKQVTNGVAVRMAVLYLLGTMN